MTRQLYRSVVVWMKGDARHRLCSIPTVHHHHEEARRIEHATLAMFLVAQPPAGGLH